MRVSSSASLPTALLLLIAGSAYSQLRIIPAHGELPPELAKRQTCSSLDTCSECFGEGYVMCAGMGCFNPDKGHKCCANGSMCIAKDDSCCEYGPGSTMSDGHPTTASTAFGPMGTSWTCTKDDDDEECCQRGGKDHHWCSGVFPRSTCYNEKLQVCCADGSICEGDDCCDIVDSVPTTPYTNVKPTSTGSKSDLVFPTATTTNADEGGGTVTVTAAETSSTNIAAGMDNVVGGMATIAMGVLGLVML